MNPTQQGIITLLKSAVTGEKYELPEGFALDGEEAIDVIKRHHLMVLMYAGAVNCGIPSDLPIMKRLFFDYYKHMIRSERQTAAAEKVFQAFDQHGIDYLPTKGCNMKLLYPKPEMRVMGDVDISIRKEQREEIMQLMPELGYTLSDEGNTTMTWDNASLHLELHKHMCSYYNEAYYDDVWERATCTQGRRFVFSTEDGYIHLFNHFARHYRIGGIGCRHIVDLYVYRLAHPDMDEAYILQEMKKLHLQKFYEHVSLLLKVWFDGAASDEVVEVISQYIFNSGSWGTPKSHITAGEIKQETKEGKAMHYRFRAILRSLFPPVDHMASHYPIVKKAPYLLPFTWVMRGVSAVIGRRKHIAIHMDLWRMIEDEKVTECQAHYKRVGLGIEKGE